MRSCLFTMVASLLVAPSAQALELHLVCRGETSRNAPQTGYASAYGSGGYASGSVTVPDREITPDTVSIEVTDAAARVQVPPKMLPPIHGAGHDGWWSLSDLRISDSAITGRYKVNIFNTAKVVIDRRTGALSIDGLTESFRGICEVADPAARKF